MGKIFVYLGSAVFALVTLGGCGTKEKKETVVTPAGLANESSTGGVEGVSSEALEAASAGEGATGNSGAGLNMSALPVTAGSLTRTCAAVTGSANKVLVTITAPTLNRTDTQTRKRKKLEVTVTHTVTGSATQTRTWEQTNISCDASGAYAKPDFTADFTAAPLTVVVTADRSRTNSVVFTSAGQTVKEITRTWSVTGNRTVAWTSQTSDATTTTRLKTVTSNVVRTGTNKDGTTSTVSVKTEENKPLKISVVRNTSSKKITEKTIISGTVDATLKTGEKLVTTFTEMKLTHSQDSAGAEECKMTTGSFIIDFYDAAGVKKDTATCAVDAVAGFQCSLSNGDLLEDVKAPSCDPLDFF